MREQRQTSILVVAKSVGLKPKDLDYMEQGKKPILDEVIQALLDHYNFSREVYNELLAMKPLTKQSVNQYFINGRGQKWS